MSRFTRFWGEIFNILKMCWCNFFDKYHVWIYIEYGIYMECICNINECEWNLYGQHQKILGCLLAVSEVHEKRRSYEDVARFCSIVPFTLLIRLGQSAFSCKHQYMENKGSTSSQILQKRQEIWVTSHPDFLEAVPTLSQCLRRKTLLSNTITQGNTMTKTNSLTQTNSIYVITWTVGYVKKKYLRPFSLFVMFWV